MIKTFLNKKIEIGHFVICFCFFPFQVLIGLKNKCSGIQGVGRHGNNTDILIKTLS